MPYGDNCSPRRGRTDPIGNLSCAIGEQTREPHFYAGGLWGSSTLAWDAAWFRAHGVKMPKGAHYVVPGRDKIPLTDKLDPTDTGVMRLQFREIR